MKRSYLKKIIKKIVQESIKEKKIGFNRGPEYSEETEDLLNDFAKSTEIINKELSKKIIDNDDPKVQEILNILDDNVNSKFIEDLETVYNLIQELPDKPTETPKIGFEERKKRANTPSGDMAYTQTVNEGHCYGEDGKPMPEAHCMEEEDMSVGELLEMEVIDENITEAKYKGKTVQLNKPTRGDSKKFKVYVNSGKKNADGSIKVKKVNFGHGGTSAKKAGQKTMKIRKSNPKARKAFRARHNCDNPGPKTMARYWSCKKW